MQKTEKIKFFSFPELINEVSARLVAFGVLAMSISSLILINLENPIVIFVLCFLVYGFLARVSSGPKISPLALLVTKIIVPRLNFQEKLVPGAPKRFAQAIGLLMSLLILMSYLLGSASTASILLVILIGFSFLESVLGYCFGCKVFKGLMKLGVIPSDVCEKCANYSY